MSTLHWRRHRLLPASRPLVGGNRLPLEDQVPSDFPHRTRIADIEITPGRLVHPVGVTGDHLGEPAQTTPVEARVMTRKATLVVTNGRAAPPGQASDTHAKSRSPEEQLTKVTIPNITTIRPDPRITASPVARTTGGQVNISQPTLTGRTLTTHRTRASKTTTVAHHDDRLARKYDSLTVAQAVMIGPTDLRTDTRKSRADRNHTRTQVLEMMPGGFHPRMMASTSTANLFTRRQGSLAVVKVGTMSLVKRSIPLEVSRADRGRPRIWILRMMLEGGTHHHMIASTSHRKQRKRFRRDTGCQLHRQHHQVAHETNSGSQRQHLGKPLQPRRRPAAVAAAPPTYRLARVCDGVVVDAGL